MWESYNKFSSFRRFEDHHKRIATLFPTTRRGHDPDHILFNGFRPVCTSSKLKVCSFWESPFQKILPTTHATFLLKVYMGELRNKCVQNMPDTSTNVTYEDWYR